MRQDVTVSGHGNIYTLTLQTRKAQRWVRENVEVPDWAWLGRVTLTVDHHLVVELLQGMQGDGLKVS